MTTNLLWSPDNKDNNLNKFQRKYNKYLKDKSYKSLHDWSILKKKEFWSAVWDYTNIKGIKKDPIIENEEDFINSIFFKNSKLNYTKNIISKKNDDDAIVFFSEQNFERRLSWKKLDIEVDKISKYLKKINIIKGDRVAGILPNIPETIVSFLAVAKIGGIWSSCSADFGPKAILDRFKQISPKVLFISDEYFYNNKKITNINNINEIILELPSVKEVIIIPYDHRKSKDFNFKFNFKKWDEIIDKDINIVSNYENFEFNIPLYILFSSGTTGEPKCITHGAGGSLIQHKKEHQIHCDINENDKVFYFTTCGWMMWNWLVSVLASKATIYLYDGSPFFPNLMRLFEIIEKEKITFFGTGAKYLDYLKQKNVTIKDKYNLEYLKTIASTGSPLMHETFNYVYEKIKKDVHLASISGGTDIVSCFVLGNPNESVFSGEIQSKGLGMDVDIFNEKGESIIEEKGELVCKSPFPSKPLYFWSDFKKLNYFKTYYSKYKNIWHHGDYAEITENNGFVIHGRSDATLNSGGIRIGTSEIYRVIENIDEIEECIAVEHKIINDTEIILFIKLKSNNNLDKLLENKIKNDIKKFLSPKHLPAKIFEVKDIPKTKSGKIVELTVKSIINNEKIQNLSSLINSDCLLEYKLIAKELSY